MRRRIFLVGVIAVLMSAAVTAGGLASRSASEVSGSLLVVGPWLGADARSFNAVLDGFRRANPDVSVSYGASIGGVAPALSQVSGGKTPDVGVLPLPEEHWEMGALVASGTIKPIGFAAQTVDSNYAFAWKQLATVNGKLYGVFVAATDRSAFWYDKSAFKTAAVAPPRTWQELQQASGKILATGRRPFAISGASGQALVWLFENVYLNQQGSRRYDLLSQRKLAWSDPSVKAALKTMRNVLARPALVAGDAAALEETYTAAVSKVFVNPPKAAMVIGGTAALPIARSLPRPRPPAQIGVFAFPTIGKPPGRAIGDADAIVMVNDTPAARALISYLATPQAATIWAKRGGFLSPNRNVNTNAYPDDATRTLAQALTSANTFRFGLTDLQTPRVTATLTELLPQFIRDPSKLNTITAQLDAAARNRI